VVASDRKPQIGARW